MQFLQHYNYQAKPPGKRSHWVCKPAYLVPVPSQDKLGGLQQEGYLSTKSTSMEHTRRNGNTHQWKSRKMMMIWCRLHDIWQNAGLVYCMKPKENQWTHEENDILDIGTIITDLLLHHLKPARTQLHCLHFLSTVTLACPRRRLSYRLVPYHLCVTACSPTVVCRLINQLNSTILEPSPVTCTGG